VEVDVVVVSYNSRAHLRRCVEPLASVDGVRPIVVDNASPDRSLEVLDDLSIETIQMDENRGFAAGCNAGWRAGAAPHVLFLNPDAALDESSLARLVEVLEREPGVGIVAPRILENDGSLAYSQRRFPTLRSTYSRALFLHRAFPRSAWTGELVRDSAAYSRPGSPQWVSGACLLVRRSLLEELNGLDEGFFLYCEDKDLCRRARDAGYDIRFAPDAVAVHEGGGSAPRPGLLPVLAESRLRYARKHSGRATAALERVGVGLSAATHALVSRGGRASRAGHLASLRAVVSPRPRRRAAARGDA
jgi:N-acetylglucosaminyl-diphospho-decaprenol L-rhamnosyltransferase